LTCNSRLEFNIAKSGQDALIDTIIRAGEPRTLANLEWQCDVLVRVPPGYQCGILKYVSKIWTLGEWIAGSSFPKQNFSSRWRCQARDRSQKSALSTARGSDESDDFAWRNLQRDVGKDALLSKVHREILNLNAAIACC
jgi:hypothetical protein